LATAATSDATPKTPFDALGGHATMLAICNRFYDLMDEDPAYAELRAIHASDLTRMRTALASFLAGWAGGPRDWFETNPGRCMMSVHKPYTITPGLAAQWAEAMQRAIAEVAPANAALGKQMGEILADLALGMGR
jgi:hemoglobin